VATRWSLSPASEFNRYDSARQSASRFAESVIAVDARSGKVKVEGAMLVKRHRKPVPQMNQQGGIIEQEAWVDLSNVAAIDPETGKPTTDQDMKSVTASGFASQRAAR
jgi:ribosomal protein L24